MGEKIVALKQHLLERNKDIAIQEMKQKKLEQYQPDFKLFVQFCNDAQVAINFDSALLFLHDLIEVQQCRLSTFNKRYAGIKHWLMMQYGEQLTEEQKEQVQLLRQLYNQEKYLRLKPMRGVRAEKQSDVLRLIDRYDTNKKGDIRKRAICLVNLITANRPSEMVRLKVNDFDLANRTVYVMMVKQGEMKEKRLTLECVQAIQKYVEVCELSNDDYFVGAADKWGNHTSRQITEVSYNQAIQSWLGFAPYTFRKTQITTMYQKGADIPTIAKQSGHKSHQTIMEHYIKLRSDDVEGYL